MGVWCNWRVINWRIMHPMKYLEKLLLEHSWLRRSIILLVLALVGWLDYLTWYDLAFGIFYLAPIAIVAWFDHFKATVITIALAALVWVYVDFNSGRAYSHTAILYWNMSIRIIFFCIVAFLIYKIRMAVKELTAMAMKDSLTSLNNTRALNLIYEQIKKQHSRKKQNVAIALIDLDGFKNVNDTLGHSVGDGVLIKFAALLSSSVRASDTVARMGGDEFVVLLMDVQIQDVHEYEKRLRDIFRQSTLLDDYGVNFSMGIQIFSDLPESLDAATHQADLLMYKSKLNGKSRSTIRMHKTEHLPKHSFSG